MAAAKLVKVVALVDFQGNESVMLWGVMFSSVDGVYVAELPEDEAAAMIEAGRVKRA